jgi:hypothetical protein
MDLLHPFLSCCRLIVCCLRNENENEDEDNEDDGEK